MTNSEQAKAFLRSPQYRDTLVRFTKEARTAIAKGLESASIEDLKGFQGRIIAYDYILSDAFEAHILSTLKDEEGK